MAIDRIGPTPSFFEYVTKRALLPQSNSKLPNQIFEYNLVTEFLKIPSYQRGISWKLENVVEFLEHDSKLIGNVILSNTNDNDRGISICALIDGLQRFATGTILLNAIDDLVFSSNAKYGNHSSYFNTLYVNVQNYRVVYKFNDDQFSKHTRKILCDQYNALKQSIEHYVDEQLNNNVAKFAQYIENAFIRKQIAIDVYYNFNSNIDVMNTFLGINTVRVELGPIDILRSYFVEKATQSNWQQIQIESFENDFNDVFMVKDKPDDILLPFVNVILKTLDENCANNLIPSWNSSLNLNEVNNFLTFVDKFNSINNNNYINEIKECGGIPFAILLVYYYVKYVQNNYSSIPSFFNGGTLENAELHKYLIACYRGLIEGKITRIRYIAEEIAKYNKFNSLTDVADEVSMKVIKKHISDKVDKDWLKVNLRKIDKNKAKRIFNAMLLSKGSVQNNNFGGKFDILNFGRKKNDFTIDHLIPQSRITPNTPGAMESDTICNFAPIPFSENSQAKTLSCSNKLAQNSIYSNYINSNNTFVHYYCDWLVRQHYHNHTNNITALDDQNLLVTNANPSIGDERINKIADELYERI